MRRLVALAFLYLLDSEAEFVGLCAKQAALFLSLTLIHYLSSNVFDPSVAPWGFGPSSFAGSGRLTNCA